MHEHQNGRASWGMPSPGEILLRIEGRLGGLERGQELTLDAVREGFRKIDHAHARVTRLDQRVVTLEQSGPPPTGSAGLLSSLTGLATAVKEILPLAGVILWLLLALGAAIDPEVPRALIGIE